MAETAQEHVLAGDSAGFPTAGAGPDGVSAESALSARDQQMLSLERQWWKYAGATIPCWSRDCVDYVHHANVPALPVVSEQIRKVASRAAGCARPVASVPASGTPYEISKDVVLP